MPRPPDRRAKIDLLRAAEAVFAEKGLAEAKVEDITSRAGVSKGSFYSHFGSKEDCFKSIVEAFVARLSAATDELIEKVPVDGDVEELVPLMFEHDLQVFEFCWQNRALMRMLSRGGAGSGAFAYLVDEFSDRVRERIAQWIRAAAQAGLYRDVDAEIASSLLAGGYDRLVRELISAPKKPDLDRSLREAMGFFMRALAKDPERWDRALRAVPPARPSGVHAAAKPNPTRRTGEA